MKSLVCFNFQYYPSTYLSYVYQVLASRFPIFAFAQNAAYLHGAFSKEKIF
jgi:hypothetical protein